jgi:uncharacterized membrane protein YhaH (DUF805 family)
MEWYKKVLSQYSDFNGRARRQEYWMFQLFNFLIGLAIMVVIGGLAMLTSSQTLLYVAVGVLFIYGLAVMVPNFAVTARRLHDTDRSGWWQLLTLLGIVPFVGWIGSIVVFVFCALEGNQGPNQYGPDPKGVPDAGFSYGYPAPGMPY